VEKTVLDELKAVSNQVRTWPKDLQEMHEKSVQAAEYLSAIHCGSPVPERVKENEDQQTKSTK
jgi:hypothetical protein